MQEQIKKRLSKKREKQTRYLSQAIQLEEAVNPHIIRATMGMVSLAILAFVVWTAFTNVNEIARTPGEVVPAGYQQTVQHLEGGMVKQIHVQEGDVVQKGDLLLTLDAEGLAEDLERARSKQMTLNVQAERLRAFIEAREPDFKSLGVFSDDALTDQETFFKGMKSARDGEAEIIREQIAEKKQTQSSLQSDLETAQANLNIAQEMYQRRQKLNKQGYASDMQLLADRQKVNDLKGQIKRIESQMVIADTAIREYESRLDSLSARHTDESNERLDVILAEADQNAKIIEKLEQRLTRLEIRAPTEGLIKGLAVNTIGAVVTPAETIMEIVPLGESLQVEVKISPQDIGHLAVGQDVQVKFSTYDFSRYGVIKGELSQISASTFTGDAGERYYRGRILLNKNYVGGNDKNVILPGMTVMADVITGEKTILQYLLKPIHLSLKTAFTER